MADDTKEIAWRAFRKGWSKRGGTDREPKNERTARTLFECWWEVNHDS